MSKKNSSAKRSWLGRLFFGGSKGLADDIEAKRAAKNDVEEIVSPVKQIVRGFMERKLAVGALLAWSSPCSCWSSSARCS